ncbi:hypothetical protein EMIHUDRAFT_200170 [Emiliania huxleyi CCMP1516]|uniref:Prolyl 4-hydroxylase alpha subunit domain-containing protein n=2 Tax=Emiliania huxleyi TaxID=2903 RepID=A0A0D3KV35_EMIH1|nr:hypothetical protein EMIHUDRAFT_200170 [Emiliania huxleyi CCMP1516]EOD39620.1 hypothetical protein EMIHUDRAFT_200170 [Emiliania huxleyi CCMP1516]|eukprot:XP_005792049.1 hypothetical protein EMIHUDRAFT_200170 [Emiliania huxleyi CCMP1516]
MEPSQHIQRLRFLSVSPTSSAAGLSTHGLELIRSFDSPAPETFERPHLVGALSASTSHCATLQRTEACTFRAGVLRRHALIGAVNATATFEGVVVTSQGDVIGTLAAHALTHKDAVRLFPNTVPCDPGPLVRGCVELTTLLSVDSPRLPAPTLLPFAQAAWKKWPQVSGSNAVERLNLYDELQHFAPRLAAACPWSARQVEVDDLVIPQGTFALNHFHFLAEQLPNIILAAHATAGYGDRLLLYDQSSIQRLAIAALHLEDRSIAFDPCCVYRAARLKLLVSTGFPLPASAAHLSVRRLLLPSRQVPVLSFRRPDEPLRCFAAAPGGDCTSLDRFAILLDRSDRSAQASFASSRILADTETHATSIAASLHREGKLQLLLLRAALLPAAEQVWIFSKAHVLLGAHGAGLTNLVFMSRQSAVLELLPTRARFNNHIAPCVVGRSRGEMNVCGKSQCGFSHFWALAAEVGVAHYALPIADAAWGDRIAVGREALDAAVIGIVRSHGGSDWDSMVAAAHALSMLRAVQAWPSTALSGARMLDGNARWKNVDLRGDLIAWVPLEPSTGLVARVAALHATMGWDKLRLALRLVVEALNAAAGSGGEALRLPDRIMLSRYPAGARYSQHSDVSPAAPNRRVTAILYLNNGWESDHGGELVLHPPDGPQHRIAPRLGRLLLFNSTLGPGS